jgi:hypothetical protein
LLVLNATRSSFCVLLSPSPPPLPPPLPPPPLAQAPKKVQAPKTPRKSPAAAATKKARGADQVAAQACKTQTPRTNAPKVVLQQGDNTRSNNITPLPLAPLSPLVPKMTRNMTSPLESTPTTMT